MELFEPPEHFKGAFAVDTLAEITTAVLTFTV
jgi:hypothetical protein